MKKNLILSVLIVLLTTSYSLKSQNLVVKNQSKSSLTLRLIIDNYDIKEIHEGNETMHEVALNSITIPNDKGKPNLPSVNRFIAIPNNAKAKVVVNNCKKEIIQDINIAPSRGIVSEYDTTNSDYIKDADIYLKDEMFPANIVSITEQVNMRGIEAIGLSISPVQYNPVKKELVVYSEIELTVEYEGGDSKFGDDRLRSIYWDPILKHNLLNYDVLPEIDYASRMQRWIADKAEGAEYLIIIPDDESFREHAQLLADYRKKQGIITKVYSLKDINAATHDELRNWIIDGYNNWEVAPVGICMLGDYSTSTTEGIPAFTFYFYATAPFISDRPYSDVDNDFLPDMAISRLSATNANEARILVNKQIDYEFNNPVMDEDFYKSPIMTCAFQQEKWFQISTESVNGYLSSIGKEPFRYTMHYYYTEYDGDVWSSADNTEQILNYFGPEGLGYIPATPDELGGFIENDMDETYLLEKISNEPGYILLNRDHGWFSIWDCPHLSSHNISTLTNYNKFPFVLSINCASGAFDKDNCLTESFMKSEDIGAVGVIAATYETHTYTNDSYIWGIWDFFENDFLPDYGTGVDNNNNYMPAFANASAKHFIFQLNFPNTFDHTREVTSNLFHAHCDAFLKLYSEVPQQINVEHDDIFYCEDNTFNVKAPSGSTITISTKEANEIKILAVTEGTGNIQSINIPNVTIPGEKLIVTVTKTNHLRYEKEVIISTNEAFVTIDDFNLYEDSHDITINQDTYIDFNLKNIGKKNASEINLSLSCNSDMIDITNNNNYIDEINYDAVVNVDDAFHLDITDGISNGSIITFTLIIEHDGISHEEEFEILVNSYNFKIIKIDTEETGGNGDNIIDPGEFAKFILTIENDGNYDMENILANLICNDNDIRVISENIATESLNIGERTDIEFETYIEWNVEPEPVSMTLELNIDNCIIKQDFIQYIGTLVESFENETLDNELWTNNSNRPWYIDKNTAFEGSHSLRSGKIGDNQSTSISITLESFTNRNISFYYKVSTEEYWDYFIFSIDGATMLQEDGDIQWQYAEFFVPKGEHTYTWTYTKDFSSEGGYDCAWIDFISFPFSSCTNTVENEDKNISIYPNPVKDFINIEINDESVNAQHIAIYNSAGICVLEQEYKNNVDIRNLTSGFYLINIYCDDKIYRKKIFIY